MRKNNTTISFRDFIAISEGKQVGTLYHFTRLGNLANMLDDGFNMESNNEYISFTRDYNLIDFNKKNNQLAKNTKYTNNWGEDYFVRLSIDGDKLSNKYKIEPFNDLKNGVTRKNSESEERILGRASLDNYIKQIDIIYGSLDKEKLEKELMKTRYHDKYNFNYIKEIKNLKKVR